MISSMTAFAKAQQVAGALTVEIEVRSLNHKYLDVVVRTPHGYDILEEQIRKMVAGRISRGRIEIKVRIQDELEDSHSFQINESLAQAYHQALVGLKERLQLDESIRLDHVIMQNGIITAVEVEKDLDRAWTAVNGCLESALEEVLAMRRREGRFLQNDFDERLAAIEKSLETITSLSSDLPRLYQERLAERVAALTKGVVEIDSSRLAQEAAFLADRSDISEEITRAKSHIHQFRKIMDAEEPGGRKLNFLLQELNREFNTMGSKSGNAGLSHEIVAVKSEIEKIREQVQNVE